MAKSRARKPWVMPTHTLSFPITTEDGDKITEIPLRAFSVAEHRKALAEVSDDSDAQFEALVLLSSGLDEEVVDQLSRPDFVSLAKLINEYVNLPASFFLARKPEDPNAPPLLVPIKGITGTVTALTLTVPALKATKMMNKLKTANERADFISAHCTGLSVPEIQMLSCPDWSQLQDRLNDFLNKPADFFQSETST